MLGVALGEAFDFHDGSERRRQNAAGIYPTAVTGVARERAV
jgi:hypothetical protein